MASNVSSLREARCCGILRKCLGTEAAFTSNSQGLLTFCGGSQGLDGLADLPELVRKAAGFTECLRAPVVASLDEGLVILPGRLTELQKQPSQVSQLE